MLTPAQLTGAAAVTYRSTLNGASDGRRVANFDVDTPEGPLDSGAVSSVLNRAQYLEPIGFGHPDDESYAVSERAALLAAMTELLDCPVFNRSNGASLGGPPAFPLHWLFQAARLGLPVHPITLSGDGVRVATVESPPTVLTVIDGQVDPAGHALSQDLQQGLKALGAALGCGFLQVQLVPDGRGQYTVLGIDPFPSRLSDRDLDRLTQALTRPRLPSTDPTSRHTVTEAGT